jgi:DNA-binding transcriptional ArsR family regulator
MVNQTADLDLVFRALADPGRRLMMERLSQGSASVSELGKPLAMSLAAVVQHVQVLEASGLVRSQKVGRTRTCSINPAALRSAEAWISARHNHPSSPLHPPNPVPHVPAPSSYSM